jgi:Protein of unknown function (DUF3306)
MSRRGEGFLTRWSRRKLRAALAPDVTAPAPDAASATAPPDPVNPEDLPALDSLGATSDFTPFLAPGVPAELTRGALRRAWATDPAIRDFVGLAENAWDFTAPEGVPGFGALSAEEASRLLNQLMPPTPTSAEPAQAKPSDEKDANSGKVLAKAPRPGADDAPQQEDSTESGASLRTAKEERK